MSSRAISATDLRGLDVSRYTDDDLLDLKRACLGLDERARRELCKRKAPAITPAVVSIEPCPHCGATRTVNTLREHAIACEARKSGIRR